MAAAQDKSDIDLLKSDLAALRNDLASLIEHVKSGAATGAAQQASSQLGDEALHAEIVVDQVGQRLFEAAGIVQVQQLNRGLFHIAVRDRQVLNLARRSQRGLAKYRLQQMLMQLHNILLRASSKLVWGCVLFLLRETRTRGKGCAGLLEETVHVLGQTANNQDTTGSTSI